MLIVDIIFPYLLLSYRLKEQKTGGPIDAASSGPWMMKIPSHFSFFGLFLRTWCFKRSEMTKTDNRLLAGSEIGWICMFIRLRTNNYPA